MQVRSQSLGRRDETGIIALLKRYDRFKARFERGNASQNPFGQVAKASEWKSPRMSFFDAVQVVVAEISKAQDRR